MDIIAKKDYFTPGTSNPSSITFGLGGVGYNIFQGIQGEKRFITNRIEPEQLLSFFGDDVNTEDIEFLPGKSVRPPVYVALMEKGLLHIGASDFSDFESTLSGAAIIDALNRIGKLDFLVLDGNLSSEVLKEVTNAFSDKVKIAFEPISVEKAVRHREGVSGVFLATPSTEELWGFIAGGVTPESMAGPPPAASIFQYMQRNKIQHIICTQGPEGVTWYHKGKMVHMKPEKVLSVQDTNGAGDRLMGRLITNIAKNKDVRLSIQMAQKDTAQYIQERNGDEG